MIVLIAILQVFAQALPWDRLERDDIDQNIQRFSQLNEGLLEDAINKLTQQVLDLDSRLQALTKDDLIQSFKKDNETRYYEAIDRCQIAIEVCRHLHGIQCNNADMRFGNERGKYHDKLNNERRLADDENPEWYAQMRHRVRELLNKKEDL